MTPEERGRAMYESAPGDGGENRWEHLSAGAQQEWIEAAAKYEERTQPTVRFEPLGRDIVVTVDDMEAFRTREYPKAAEMLAKALGAKVVRS